MTKSDIVLLGGGGHCKSCIDVLETTGLYNILGILDKEDKAGEKVLNYEVIGTDEDIPNMIKSNLVFLITIGQIESARRRIELFLEIKKLGGEMPVIVSPSAYISKHSVIGEGSIIMHDTVINAGAKVGVNCIINSKALLEHDVIIGNHCHISTGVLINGSVSVGDESFVGSGTVIVQNAIIPQGTFIKANTLYYTH